LGGYDYIVEDELDDDVGMVLMAIILEVLNFQTMVSNISILGFCFHKISNNVSKSNSHKECSSSCCSCGIAENFLGH